MKKRLHRLQDPLVVMLGGFTFQAGARPIEQGRQKYRNEPDGPCMITVDPRVCRGSTYSKHKPVQEETQQVKTRRKISSPRAREMPTNSLAAPPQRENRIDLEIQTEPYLQEVVEKPVLESRLCQTDAFLDRPPSPPFVPPKTGTDVETQVEENELFDWDFEVQPIVSTIVGKTLEQAFLEVLEEEELASIRRHKEAIEHQRNVELADVQRLEEAERRKFEEKQKRLEERLKVEEAQTELRNKIAARGYGEFFASDLMGDAISLLERRGYFYDEVEKEIETQFLPWLGKAMEEASDSRALSDAICNTVIQSTLTYEARMRAVCARESEQNADSVHDRRKAMLRRMLIEDVAGVKIRKAMEGQKKKQKVNDEEEEKNEE